jgi:hypothetical protein
MTINALVVDNEMINYLNSDSINADQLQDSFPKHIYATASYIEEDLKELLESFDSTLLTIAEAIIEADLPEDFELI